MKSLVAAFLVALSGLAAGQDIPLFTSDFPPEEFAQRRARIFESIDPNALALLQGAPSPQGYTRFRQYNEFYYVCGVEVPHAYILLDGARKQATVYLPHRNERRERSEGKLLSAEDGELVQKLTGIENVAATDLLAEHLAAAARSTNIRTIYTPFQPGEGIAMSRDLALRYNADIAADPFDGRTSREGRFVLLVKERFPMFELKDLSPILDNLRMIKSERELQLIRKATRLGGLALIEGMRSTAPGIMEYELDAMAKYIFYRNGAQGEAYYSLIASGPNALVGHYNAGKRIMKDGDMLLFDFAPDVGYYMSDVTRVWPVNGTFSPSQRELYAFYLACYKAILNAIRPGVTAQAIKREIGAEMEKILAKTKFSKPLYEEAAKRFVSNYKNSAANPATTMGHWTGMATHDVGFDPGPLKPGMVFTIEPSLVVREENINIRLEDLVIITQKGKEVVSEFIPMEIEEIEKLMKEDGILQRYQADTGKSR
ncbi:MAG: aminopeptidase P family protein [Ignavibacteriales bacterium]|nr:aminopeptidase P family protein [Ignavibacteriales bacterium]